MKRTCTLLFQCICALLALGFSLTTSAAPDPNFHIYLLLGQSNMQGAAHLPSSPITHPRVQVMQAENCSERTTRYGGWRELAQPICRCKINEPRAKTGGGSGLIGLGPGDMFGVTMANAASPNVKIGLVGVAYGDTSIEFWSKNCAEFGRCNPPAGGVSGAPGNGNNGGYVWIVDLAKKAQQDGVIKGIIFHQGENNAGQATWLPRVKQFVTDLRNDLGLDPNEVPFIAGELPHTGGSARSHNPIVQKIDDPVGQGGIQNGWWVSGGPMPNGTVLGDRGDGIHWSTDSVIEMGKRYAAKMLEKGNYGPVNCGDSAGNPVCCSMSADPDGDGIGQQNGGEQCVITEKTPGWHAPNPNDVALAINVGGSGEPTQFGDIWFDADKGFTGGTPNATTRAISGADSSSVYQSERYGTFSYKLPLANGDYTVELGMVEIYQTASGTRTFDVSIEGTNVLKTVDVFAQVGRDAVLRSDEFDVTVRDGNLDITVTSIKDNGTLSSILVRKKTGFSSVPSSSVSSSSRSSSSSSSSSSSASSTGQTTTAGAMNEILLLILAAGLLATRRRTA